MKNILWIIVGVLIPFCSIGQDDLPGGEVEVIKNFEANLIDAEKIDVKGTLPPLDTKRTKQEYEVPAKSLTVDYAPPVIRPIGIKTSRPPKGYNGYIKAGYGYPSSPLLQAYYNISKRKKYDFNIDINHFSANNSKNLENQRFSNTGANVSGTIYGKSGIALGGNLGYQADKNYLYGYNHEDTSFTADAALQKFNTIKFGLNVHNSKSTDNNIDYFANMNTYRLTDNFAGKEAGLDIHLGATKWLNEKNPLTVKFHSQLTSFNDTSKVVTNLFLIQPSYTHHFDALSVKLGANLAYYGNDIFSIMPDVMANYNLGDTGLNLFAGWEGSIQKNSYRNFVAFNPYTNKRGLIIKDSKYNKIYAGVKGATGKLKYKGLVSYNTIEDMPLYIKDFLDTRVFNVVYDTAKVTKIQLYADYSLNDILISLNLSQKIFSLNNLAKPYHLPAFEANLSMQYALLTKKNLHVNAELYLANGIPYINDQQQSDNLNTLLDVSVGADYYFTKKIGMFIDLNNIANNKRQRWDQYPNFGINVIGGVKVRF